MNRKNQKDGEKVMKTFKSLNEMNIFHDELLKKILKKRKEEEEVKLVIDVINYRIEEQIEKHKITIQQYRENIKEFLNSGEEVTYKLNLVDKINMSIVNFYLRTIDRSHHILRDERVKENEERELYLKENPLILLEKLSANLRVLISFKQDFSKDMVRKKREQNDRANKELVQLREKMLELQSEKTKFLENQKEALKEKTLATESQKITILESKILIRRIQKHNCKLIDEIQLCSKLINNLHKKLDSREKELRKREIQKNKIQELESKNLEITHKHRYEKNKIKSEIYKIFINYKRKIKHYNTMKSECTTLKKEITVLKDRIKKLNLYAKRERVVDLQKSMRKINDKLTLKTKKAKEIKNQNIKLSTKLDKAKKRGKLKKFKGSKSARSFRKESYFIFQKEDELDLIKKRLKEKDVEATRLKKYVQRMIKMTQGGVELKNVTNQKQNNLYYDQVITDLKETNEMLIAKLKNKQLELKFLSPE